MANPFATETELTILRLLRDSRSRAGLYGLEIVRQSEERLEKPLSRGTVYTLLGRMEEKGFVRSKARASEGHAGLPRPRYTLTALGEAALHAARALQIASARA
jgi:DNA-binding PadR family transcriptional regulator